MGVSVRYLAQPLDRSARWPRFIVHPNGSTPYQPNLTCDPNAKGPPMYVHVAGTHSHRCTDASTLQRNSTSPASNLRSAQRMSQRPRLGVFFGTDETFFVWVWAVPPKLQGARHINVLEWAAHVVQLLLRTPLLPLLMHALDGMDNMS